jgi:hypothetical protein
MRPIRAALGFALVAVACLGWGRADGQPAKAEKTTPDVTGKWVGTWGPLETKPGQKEKAPDGMPMECVVTVKDGTWSAMFEGECGRPYKYTVKMDGRAAGSAVLFKGTTDLGEKDGGIYDWIGRADDKEFVGFYTSERYTGLFRLKRAK